MRTVILAARNKCIEASLRLQESLFYIQNWLKKWRIGVNGAKSGQVTFITRRETCLPINLNGLKIPQAENAKYLGIHVDHELQEAHIHQVKTTWNSIGQNVLAGRQ